MKNEKRKYLLQLFAEDAAPSAAGQGGEAGSTAVEAEQPAGEEAAENMADPAAEFEELIKGKYKQQYNERVQKIIDKRFRKAKEDEARLKSLLSGGEATEGGTADADGENENAGNGEKTENDGKAAETEEAGKTDAGKLDEFKKKNELLKARKNRFADWMSQSERLKAKYPAFDFAAEVKKNPEFVELLNSGASVEAAFKTANFDYFLREARNSAAREAKAALVSSVRSNGIRPVENGMESGTPAIRSNSPGSLSLSEINDLFARAGRGEKITFR